MGNQLLFDRVIDLMEDRLTLNSKRQEIIASNIANIDTPGYVAKDISFEDTLKEALKPRIHLVTSNENHIRLNTPQEAVEEAAREPNIEKTGPVDLETEMTRLARNNLEYQFIVTMLTKKFTLLKMALTEGEK